MSTKFVVEMDKITASTSSSRRGVEVIFDLIEQDDANELEKFLNVKGNSLALLLKNEDNQTALSRAIRLQTEQHRNLAVIKTLLSHGAADTLFVQGHTTDSLVCTCPMTEQPPSNYAKHPKAIGDVDPEVVNLLDVKLCEHIQSLVDYEKKQAARRSLLNQPVVAPTVTPTGLPTPPPPAFNHFPATLAVGQVVRRGVNWSNNQEDEDQLPDGSSAPGAGVVMQVGLTHQQAVGAGGMFVQPFGLPLTAAVFYHIEWRSDVNDPNSSFSQSYIAYSPTNASINSLFVVDPQNVSVYPPGVYKPVNATTKVVEKFRVGDQVMLKSGYTQSALHENKPELRTQHNECLGSNLYKDLQGRKENIRSAGSVGIVVSIKKLKNQNQYGGGGLPLDDICFTVMALHNLKTCDYFNGDLQYADGSFPDCFDVMQSVPVLGAVVSSTPRGTIRPGDKVKLKKTSNNNHNCLRRPSDNLVGIALAPHPNSKAHFNVDYKSNQSYYEIKDLELVWTPPKPTSLMSGEVVKLADNFAANNGDGWCLGKVQDNKLGIVLFAPRDSDRKFTTQDDVIVASVDNPSEFYFFDSAWLQRAPAQTSSTTFKVGDRVQLRLEIIHNCKEEAMSTKCLGSINNCGYGIVVSPGVVRDGIARNIQVVAVGGHNHKMVSLYPGYALRLADRASVLSDVDKKSLRKAIDETAKAVDEEIKFDVGKFVDLNGINSWNELTDLLKNTEAVSKSWDKWHKQRNMRWDSNLEPNRDTYDPLADSSSSSAGGAADPDLDYLPFASRVSAVDEEAFWVCRKETGGKCGFVKNPINKNCKACKSRPPPDWACKCCSAKNSSNQRFCAVCFTSKDEAERRAAELKLLEEAAEKELKEQKEADKAELEQEIAEKKAELTEEGGRFLHPGSLDTCGGNPNGLIGSHGDGACEKGCGPAGTDIACGKGSHWTCCSSQDKESKYCPESMPFEKAYTNAKILSKNNLPEGKHVITCRNIPNFFTTVPMPTTWTCDACTKINDDMNAKECEVCGTKRTSIFEIKEPPVVVAKVAKIVVPPGKKLCNKGNACPYKDTAKGCSFYHPPKPPKAAGDDDNVERPKPLQRLYESLSKTYYAGACYTVTWIKDFNTGQTSRKTCDTLEDAVEFYNSKVNPKASRAIFDPKGDYVPGMKYIFGDNSSWENLVVETYSTLGKMKKKQGGDDDGDSDSDATSKPAIKLKKRTTFPEISKNEELLEKYFNRPPSFEDNEDEEDFDIEPEVLNSNFLSGAQEMLQRQSSDVFWSTEKTPSFTKIDCLNSLIISCDKNKNTAFHHLAKMAFNRSLEALTKGANECFKISRSSVLWKTNKFQDTPEGLKFGLPLQTDERRNALFRALKQCPWKPSIPDDAIRMTLRTSPGFSNSSEFDQFIQAIHKKEMDNADYYLSNVAKVPEVNLYLALFSVVFNIGFPSQTNSFMDEYLKEITTATRSDFDPLYFYLKLQLFKGATKERSPKEKDTWLAFDAYTTLEQFGPAFNKWMDIERGDRVFFSNFFNGYKSKSRPDFGEGEEDEEDDYSNLIAPPGPHDPETKWINTKKMFNLDSPTTDKLMNLVGLKNIKQSALSFMLKVILSPPPDVNNSITCNLTFVGNPGCGKTTVGELLAKAMAELKYRTNPVPELCTADDCLDPKSFDQIVKKADGGTLFIDECDTFQPSARGQPKNDSAKALKSLMRYSDAMKKTTTFILAGYKEEMDVLKSADPGFKSRFPDSLEFNFFDYNEDELTKIMYDMVKARGMRFESMKKCGVPLCRVLARRIHRGAGLKGFGNGRDCEKCIERCIEKQLGRLQEQKLSGDIVLPDDYRVLTRADCVGERPKLDESPHLAKLNKMIGLDQVKGQVKGLLTLALNSYDAEMRGERSEIDSGSLHRVFLGNPGTGKTTVVELYGKMLKEFGFLTNGEYIKRTPADILSNTQGSSGTAMAQLMESAKGKVLFIDEAYNLDPAKNPFGREVLDVLLEKTNAGGGQDMAIILAGYTAHMTDMFRNANNPGLEGRFNLSLAFNFEDYTDEQIKEVLKLVLAKKAYFCDNETLNYIVKLISERRIMDGFCNAREVDNIVSKAIISLNNRIAEAAKDNKQINMRCFLKEDFIGEMTSFEKARAVFAGKVNMEFMQAWVDELIESCIAQDENRGPGKRHELVEDKHMLFLGPPGTGKTSLAKPVAEVFKQLNLLPTNKCKIILPREVTGQYVGHSTNAMRKALDEAKGGILFIDEAYGMNPQENLFGDEIMETLFTCLTSETYKGKLIVILAGYETKIHALFKSFNPGFESRFNKKTIYFTPWTGPMATKYILNEIKNEGGTIEDDAVETMNYYFSIAVQHMNWGSARDCKENILPSLVDSRRKRQSVWNKQNKPSGAANQPKNHSAAAKMDLPPPIPYTLDDVKPVFERYFKARENQTGVHAVTTEEEYNFEIGAAGPGLVVIDIYADWCVPCQMAAPQFEKLAQNYPKVRFLKINADNEALQNLTFAHCGSKSIALPSILFLKEGKRVGLNTGFSEASVIDKIIELTSVPKPSFNKDGSGNLPKAPPPPKVEVKVDVQKAPLKPNNPQGGSRGGLDWDAIWEEFEKIIGEQNPPLDQAALEAMFSNAEGFPPRHIMDEICRRLKISVDEEADVENFLKEKRPEVLIRIQQAKEEEKKPSKLTEEEKDLKKLIPQICQCPAGFNWRREGKGWRCLGGSHLVTDEQLRRHYMKMVDGKK